MRDFKIYDDHHQVVRTKCQEFEEPIKEENIQLLKDMCEYLKLSQDDEYASKHNLRPGVGLACPQIGISKRGFAVYLEDEKTTYKFGLINPKIIRTSVKKCYLGSGEGCLSVNVSHPGYVMRYNKVVIEGFEVFQNRKVTITAYGYLAICIQHEYDHLDGILFYDHIDKKEPFKIEENAIKIA